MFLAATLILPRLNPATDAERAAMPAATLEQIQRAELSAVMTPYVGLAFVLLVIWIAIAFLRIPTDRESIAPDAARVQFAPTLRRLLSNRHYVFGVVAQFFNVAAQTCVWTFTIQYVIAAIGGTEAQAGWYLQASLIVFLIARFVMVGVMGVIRPAALLAVMAVAGTGLCLFAATGPGLAGVWAVVAVSACLSLMFPTIYGIALHGLGDDTKFGAAGLVMAILGGATIAADPWRGHGFPRRGAVLCGAGTGASWSSRPSGLFDGALDPPCGCCNAALTSQAVACWAVSRQHRVRICERTTPCLPITDCILTTPAGRWRAVRRGPPPGCSCCPIRSAH